MRPRGTAERPKTGDRGPETNGQGTGTARTLNVQLPTFNAQDSSDKWQVVSERGEGRTVEASKSRRVERVERGLLLKVES